ncbi:OmpA family protein, partial [Candidatus Sumerlaeota bacterium]|nr:OmpA family protein [Candidatus Sumerlaeota bacterium]
MKSRFVRSISARGMGRACLALLLGFALTLQGCSWFRRGDGPESRAVQVSEEVTAPGQSGIPSARPGDARPPSAPVDSRRPTEVRPSSDRMMVIFFDFDQSGLRSDQLQRIETNLLYLTENPDFNVLIEGHCDERGTTEYNYALGVRRAESVRDYFLRNGIA